MPKCFVAQYLLHVTTMYYVFVCVYFCARMDFGKAIELYFILHTAGYQESTGSYTAINILL